MKIAFNPSTVVALTTPPNNKDITFDLRGRNIFARGVKFYGTDTNTWRDIKINNVSIGSYTLDLRNGSNTTLTNTNGVVTINSTWRPVVDNLTSDSTTSSLSAKQGKVLKALIDGKSNSDHNHDGRYVKKSGDTMSGVLTIDTPNFGALTIKRNDDANGASIQFRGKSSVYGYIGLNNSTKDKQFLRWSSDTSRIYTILDTSSTYISNGKGVINGTEITQVNNSDTVDGYHATDGRTFNGDIHWGSWDDAWSDGTHTHPWYGFDHRYSETGVYSTTISDYYGMTIKTHNTLLLDCGTLLLNSRNNVGIGTTSPTQKLDVTGNIRATGQIIREGHITQWAFGRDEALLRETSAVDYHTLWSLKTTNGSWDFGEYSAGGGWDNVPLLTYITDSNYNSKNNAVTYQIKFPLDSGTVALTSNIPNPTNYYWANVKISASSSTTTSPTFSDVYLGNSLYLNNIGSNSIYNGPNDYANGVGGPLNNLVFSSWYGVSFTTSYAGLTYTNKNAVSINCRTGQLYAREVQASGFMHTGHNNNDAVLLAGGGYKTLNSIWGGDPTHFVFLGYLKLHNGDDGTISDSFMCFGNSVPFTYTRGGDYCFIQIPDTLSQLFYIEAAIASVHYSGTGMSHWVGNHRGEGSWWLHCYAVGTNAVQVQGFHPANGDNDSWWSGNPLYSGEGAAKIITVCLFGYVLFI